jgi:hypothetical protein
MTSRFFRWNTQVLACARTRHTARLLFYKSCAPSTTQAHSAFSRVHLMVLLLTRPLDSIPVLVCLACLQAAHSPAGPMDTRQEFRSCRRNWLFFQP